MKKIGIFGGTFNPIHDIHLKMAELSIQKLDLDSVIFVPALNPYHKDIFDCASFEDRIKMIELAIGNKNDKLKVSNIEKYLNLKNSYTYKLLEEIRDEYFNSDIFFILGGDSLLNIEKWKKFEYILTLSKIIVFNRQKYELEEYISYLKLNYKANIFLIEDLNSSISSSSIRNMIKNNEIDNIPISTSVYNYIKENNIYD